MKRFLVTYGPNAQIRCCECRKGTQIVAAPNTEVTHRDVAYHKRIHVCGPPSEPWDVQGEPSVPAWPARRDAERCGDVETPR